MRTPLVTFIIGVLAGAAGGYFLGAELGGDAGVDGALRIAAPLATFTAVLAALFKEDIRRFWDAPRLVARPRDNGWLYEEVEAAPAGGDAESEGDSEVATKLARRYVAVLRVSNEGRALADACEVRVEKLRPYGRNREPRPPTNSPRLLWSPSSTNQPSAGVTSMLLHASQHEDVELFSVSPLPTSNRPASPKPGRVPAVLTVGDYSWTANDDEDLLEITLAIRAKGADMTRLTLRVTWTGGWRSRLAEMAEVFRVEQI